MALKILLLVLLPFGTAILLGAASERWLGRTISGWLAVAGLMLGIYLLPMAFELLNAW